MDRPTCKTCPFWILLDENDDEVGLDQFEVQYGTSRDPVGECRRRPPKPHILVHRVNPDGWGFGSHTAVQRLVPEKPEAWPEDFCGEHPSFPAYLATLTPPARPQSDDDAVLDLIGRWHAGEGGGLPLHEFLGVSRDAYAAWVEGRGGLTPRPAGPDRPDHPEP